MNYFALIQFWKFWALITLLVSVKRDFSFENSWRLNYITYIFTFILNFSSFRNFVIIYFFVCVQNIAISLKIVFILCTFVISTNMNGLTSFKFVSFIAVLVAVLIIEFKLLQICSVFQFRYIPIHFCHSIPL